MNQDNDLRMLLLRIRNKYSSMSNKTKRIADYILNSYEEALYLNISQLADKTMVSESTIMRFIRILGYRSYRDFRITLARYESAKEMDESDYGDFPLKGDIKEICNSVFYSHISALKDTLKVLDFSIIDEVTDLIIKANKIVIYGMGSSKIATSNLRLRLYRLGINCIEYSDPHEQLISATLLNKNDIVIGISNSGMSINIVEALKIAKGNNIKTVCITGHDDTSIVKVSDYKLLTSTKDSDQLSENINARIAEIAIIDSIFVSLVKKMKIKAINNLRKTGQVIKELRQKKY